MKTKHIGIVGLILVASYVILTLYLSGQSCQPLSVYQILIIISFQIASILVVFGIFLKLTTKQRKHNSYSNASK